MSDRCVIDTISRRPSGSHPSPLGRSVHADADAQPSVEVDGLDRVVVEVAEPQLAVVPPRRLGEVQPAGQYTKICHSSSFT
jgi:hypothetical protein